YFLRFLLEANFYDAAVRSVDQPSGFWTRESYRPETAHTGQREPGASLIRSPGSGSGRERGRVIGGGQHRPAEGGFARRTSLPHIAQAEDRAGYWRGTRQRPCHTAVAGNRSARVIGISRIQIAAPHDSAVRIAKINSECARAGSAKQRSVIGVPCIAL